MARASSTKSWLWHQRLSHLNFDTINDFAKNDLVTGLLKFKFHKEHLCPSSEAIATTCFTQNCSIIYRRINKTPYELINGRKPNISFLHVFDALCYPKNDREDIGKLGAKGELDLLFEAMYDDYIGGQPSTTARTISPAPEPQIRQKPDISFLHVFGALCYPKNDRKDIGKLGAKGDIGFFIGYSADSYAYRVYNRRRKKIMETMNVLFDKLSAMAFDQRTMYDDYIGGQPSDTARTVPPAQEPQVRQSLTASTSIADTAPIPTNSSSLATNIPITSQDVDELNPNAMVDGNTFVNPFANSSTSAAASSSQQNVDPLNMYTFYQPYPHEFPWTKDHPLKQVIGEPSRPVLTRNQLRSDGDMCMYALSVSTMKPENVKEAMTDPAWIDSMQEELLQSKGLMYGC
nr:hypothetical protein [Tanacetum cinerariifolium]